MSDMVSVLQSVFKRQIQESFKDMEEQAKSLTLTRSLDFMKDLESNPGLDAIRKEMQEKLLEEQTRIIRYE